MVSTATDEHVVLNAGLGCGGSPPRARVGRRHPLPCPWILHWSERTFDFLWTSSIVPAFNTLLTHTTQTGASPSFSTSSPSLPSSWVGSAIGSTTACSMLGYPGAGDRSSSSSSGVWGSSCSNSESESDPSLSEPSEPEASESSSGSEADAPEESSSERRASRWCLASLRDLVTCLNMMGEW